MGGGRILSIACAMLALVACAAIAGLDEPASDESVDAASDIQLPPRPDVADEIPEAAAPDTRAADLGCSASAPSKLIAYWRIDEGNGTDVRNCTSSTLHGTAKGSFAWVPGRIGPHALGFDGGSVDFGNHPSFSLVGAMTVSAWVRVASYGTAGRIVSKGGGPTDRGWELNIEQNGIASFKIAPDSTTHIEAATTQPLEPNTWTHVAGVYESGVALRLYVNGALVATNADAGTSHRDTNLPVLVGNRPGDRCCPWIGEIDDVRLFGRALSAEDVAVLAAP